MMMVMNLPFIWRNRIHQNVTIDVYGVGLWEDWVFVLKKKESIKIDSVDVKYAAYPHIRKIPLKKM